MEPDLKVKVGEILKIYDPAIPDTTAAALRALWLQFEPKSMAGIKAEQRSQQETVGIPVPVLKEIGKAVAREARKHVKAYMPLAWALWERYGREGRVVAVYPLGAMELEAPDLMLPILLELCRACLTWEDADQLAMYAVEPIVRKNPDKWLRCHGTVACGCQQVGAPRRRHGHRAPGDEGTRANIPLPRINGTVDVRCRNGCPAGGQLCPASCRSGRPGVGA